MSWADDKLAYVRLLRLQGYRGGRLKRAIYFMDLKEAHCASLLGPVAVEPRLRESNDTPIDMAWVVGDTCSDVFDDLSFAQRWTLFLLYHGDKPDMSDSSFSRLMREIKRKIG